VAENAGVSTATVSRIMNGRSGSAKDTIAHVKKIARALGYTHKSNARVRNQNRSWNVVFITAGFIPQTMPYSSVFVDVLHGVEKSLSKKGTKLLFNDITNFSTESKSLQTDGLIIMGNGIDTESLRKFSKYPCMWILPNQQNNKILPTINHDDEEIGRIAFDYLRERGHREISIVNSVRNHTGCAKRVRTIQWLAEEKRIKTKVFEAAYAKNSLYNAQADLDSSCIDRFIKTLKNKTNHSTGLFSVCDQQTFHLYTALRKANIEPIRDMDIISCDNEKPFLNLLTPKPATIDIKAYLIGKKAAEMLIWQIQNFPTISNEPVRMLITPELIMP